MKKKSGEWMMLLEKKEEVVWQRFVLVCVVAPPSTDIHEHQSNQQREVRWSSFSLAWMCSSSPTFHVFSSTSTYHMLVCVCVCMYVLRTHQACLFIIHDIFLHSFFCLLLYFFVAPQHTAVYSSSIYTTQQHFHQNGCHSSRVR